MIEEIKEDNNCIIKAFENNPVSILQKDIRVSIQNYYEDEQVVRKAYDLHKIRSLLYI